MKLTLDLICFGIQKHGGITNYWVNLIDFFEKKNFDIEVILPKNSHQKLENFKNLRVLKENIPASISRYLPIRQSNQTITHSSYYRKPLFKSNILITTLYDFAYEYSEKGLKKFVHSSQKNSALRNSDAIICISESTKNILMKTTDIKEEKVYVTQLGVDNKNFYNEKDLEFEKKFKNTVLFVGSRSTYKRFDLAVNALSYESDLRLGIVGPAMNRSEINFLNEVIPERWDYLGFVDYENLRKLYSSAFAFIFPSDHEGFGLPILEAMACGCPVIAAMRTSFLEIGKSSILYAEKQEPYKYFLEIDSLKTSNEKREILKNNGILRSKIFTWNKTFEKTSEIYSKFI